MSRFKHFQNRTLSVPLALLALTLTASAQRPRANQPVSRPDTAVREDNHPTPTPGYKVLEIGEGASPITTVVMAIGQSTIFRCPEDPLQLVFGDPSAVQVVQATEQSKRGEFYLIPLKSNVNTNFWIELKSGTISARIKTVAIKGGAGPADYNNEVVVRPIGYNDEFNKTKARLVELETQVADLTSKTKIAAAAADAQSVVEQNNARALATMFSLVIPTHGKEQYKNRLQSYRDDGLFIEQLAPIRRDSAGRWWLPLSITVDRKVKKGASATYVIDRIDTKDGRLLRSSQPFPITVTPDKPVTFAVMIDAVGSQSAPAPNTSLPGSIVIMVSGGKSLVFAPIQ